MFYERFHSLSSDTLRLLEGTTAPFPAHLHRAFELVTVTEGENLLRIGTRTFVLRAGEGALIFPEQVHAYEGNAASRQLLCLFSPDLVRSYAAFAVSHVPEDPCFSLPEGLVGQLRTLEEDRRPMHVKHVLYALLDAFDATAGYVSRDREREALLLRIFQYVDEHLTDECTLKDLSRALSFHYVYLSRYFTSYTGMSFTEFVNARRVSECCARLRETDDNVTEIGLACGFDTPRSFHRNFKKYAGCTPKEYRQQGAANVCDAPT